MNKLHVCLGALGAFLTSAALAQPLVTADLGLLPPGVTSYPLGVGPGTISWLKFTVPEISRCRRVYLDIVTDGFNHFDSEMGLYTSTGIRLVNDDDDGPEVFSALTFGATSPLRPLAGNGQPGNGRDGSLLPGDYYLAVGAFNATFEDTDWSVIGDGEARDGGCNVIFTIGPGDAPNDPPGVVWENPCAGDAGDLPATAASFPGAGQLTTIHGNFGTRADIDMFRICITDAANFSADTFLSVQQDTELYLFDSTGHGVSLSDDADDSVQSHITSAVVAGRGNGVYYLAVTPNSSVPQDSTGHNLWGDNGIGERAADGPGAPNPIARWDSSVYYDNAWYIISLQGASICPAGPTCGSADFNGDGDVGTDQDIEAFFACLAGNCCATCGTADFNGDGDVGTDQDIEAFFRVLAGGTC